jgi:hypothetical protein
MWLSTCLRCFFLTRTTLATSQLPVDGEHTDSSSMYALKFEVAMSATFQNLVMNYHLHFKVRQRVSAYNSPLNSYVVIMCIRGRNPCETREMSSINNIIQIPIVWGIVEKHNKNSFYAWHTCLVPMFNNLIRRKDRFVVQVGKMICVHPFTRSSVVVKALRY